MRLHRFFIDIQFLGGNGEIDKKELVHQISSVLKIKEGEKIVLFNSLGEEATVRIGKIRKGILQFEVVGLMKRSFEKKRGVILAAAMVKRDNFELIVQKAAEVGVDEIFPVLTHRAIKLGLNLKRLQKISVEAAEQSGQVKIIKVHPPILLKDALNLSADKKIFFDIGTRLISADDFSNLNRVVLFIGPEGGWSEEEKRVMIESGAEVRGLGQNVLRAETAAIVSSFLAVYF